MKVVKLGSPALANFHSFALTKKDPPPNWPRFPPGWGKKEKCFMQFEGKSGGIRGVRWGKDQGGELAGLSWGKIKGKCRGCLC